MPRHPCENERKIHGFSHHTTTLSALPRRKDALQRVSARAEKHDAGVTMKRRCPCEVEGSGTEGPSYDERRCPSEAEGLLTNHTPATIISAHPILNQLISLV